MPSPLTRVREQTGWFAALLLAAALVAGLAVGLTGFLERQATLGVRAALADRAGAYLALRLALPLADDAAEQDAEVRAMVERRFGTVGLPIAVDRTVQGDATYLDADGIRHRVVALSLDDVRTRVELVDGDWADTEGVLVQADAAARLGLAVGDPVVLEGEARTVAGTWRATHRQDPRWLGDPLVESGGSGAAVGPMIVPAEAWERWPETRPQARWTLVPDVSDAHPDDLAGLARAWRTVHRGWDGPDGGLDGLAKSGRLLQSIGEVERTVAGFRAVEPVALLLLAAVGLVTFAELARLLGELRAAETALLWSRGASGVELAGSTAAEVATVSALGAVLGAAASAGMLATLGTAPGLAAIVLPVAATVLVATTAATVTAARSALRQTVRDSADGRGRRGALSGGAVLLVAGAAAVSVWQLRLYGSPVTPTSSGGVAVDPIAVPAPALTLAAVALTALALLPFAARLDERLSARGGVRRLLATRTVARRPLLAAAPVLAVALATGGLVTAAGYQATWDGAFGRAGEVRAGADLHVATDAPGLAAADFDALRELPGVTGVAPFDLQPLQFGTGTGTIVAVAPDSLADVAARFPGLFDPVAAAEALRAPAAGPVVPPGARGLELVLATERVHVPIEVAAIVRDGYGILRTVPLALESTEADGDRTRWAYRGALPDVLAALDTEVRIVSVDLRLPPDAVVGADTGVVRLAGLAADATPLPLGEVWFPDPPIATSSPPWPTDDGHGFEAASATERARLTATLDGTFGDQVRPPVVISRALADAYEVDVGDPLVFSMPGTPQQLVTQVAAVVPVVPSSPTTIALLLDLGILQHYTLRASDVPPGATDAWIATDDPVGGAGAARDLLPANARVDAARDPDARALLGAASVALWLAAAGCAVLAVAVAVAASRSLRRDRRRAIAILRALGLAPRDQAAIRGRELGAVLGYGVVGGLVAGVAVVLLTLPPVARAAVPGMDAALAIDPAVAVTPLALTLGGLVVALAGVVLAGRAEAVADARTASPAEESR